MSDMKPKGTAIKLGGREYGMRFTLNAIDDIQDHFDIAIADLSSVLRDEKTSIRNLKYVLTVLINEDIACRNDEMDPGQPKIPNIDERFVGRHIDANNSHEIMAKVFQTVRNHTPDIEDDATEEPDPNATSERQPSL